MRLLAILLAVGAAALAFAALHETSQAKSTYTRAIEAGAARQAARDRELAQAAHVAQVIAHTTGPLPFGLVPGAPPPAAGPRSTDEQLIVDSDDRCPDRREDSLGDDGCPDPMPEEKIVETAPRIDERFIDY